MSKKIAVKLTEAVHALRRDLAAAERADEFPEYLDPLIREIRETIEALERRRDELRADHIVPLPKSAPEEREPVQKREVLIETLALLHRSAAPTTVSRSAALMFGVDISPSQFASMRKGDERAYMRGRRRRVMLVPALSSVDLTARARTITLSDWPMEQRIIGRLSERVDALHVILRLIELMKSQPDREWLAVLRPLAQDFRFKIKAPEDAMAVREVVHSELEKIEAQDFEERHEAAVRAAKLPESRRLFGALTAIDNGGKLV
jgi:hypothetical protein